MLYQKKLKIDYNNYKYAICHFSIKGHNYAGLTLKGDSGEEVALWLLTSLCTSAKREVEVAL